MWATLFTRCLGLDELTVFLKFAARLHPVIFLVILDRNHCFLSSMEELFSLNCPCQSTEKITHLMIGRDVTQLTWLCPEVRDCSGETCTRGRKDGRRVETTSLQDTTWQRNITVNKPANICRVRPDQRDKQLHVTA